MTTILETLNKSYQDLYNQNIKTAKIDSEIILAEVLKVSRLNLITKQNTLLNRDQQNLYNSLIERRKKNEPVAYILNKKEFWNESYFVDQRVLIPRPETEVIIEMLLKKINNKSKPFCILDIGCGSGCLLISCLQELRRSKGVGVDISSAALEVAHININQNQLGSRAKLIKQDLFKLNIKKKFDIILSNPPYLTDINYTKLESDVKNYEPKMALVGGVDGLKFYKKIISIASASLKKNGFLGLEMGDRHYKEIKKFLFANSFKIIDKFKLINGEIRCILAMKIS